MLFKRKATIKLFIRHATRTFSNVLEISYNLIRKGHFKRNVGKIIEHLFRKEKIQNHDLIESCDALLAVRDIQVPVRSVPRHT